MSTLAQYSQHLARLIPAVGEAAFPELLVGLLQKLVSFDDATIVVYPGTDLPIIEYFRIPEDGGVSTLDNFVRGAFLLDPFYLAATRDRKFGVFRLRDLSPSSFRDGEYYKSWYRNCGYQDECGFLIPLGTEGFINIALGKTTQRAKFGKREVAIFEAILPIVDILCQQHWENSGSTRPSVNLRAQLHSALDCFGSSVLTGRETQVIKLVLHGHSTKSLANKLSISVETVKLHRKHAYAKLEIGSQAELFYLFLDSLMSAGNYDGGDTLVKYLQRPPPQ